MNKIKALATVVIAVAALPVLAQTPETVKPSLFAGPNMALAIVALVQLIAIISIAAILKRITGNPEYFVKLQKMREEAKNKSGLLVILFVMLAGSANAQAEAQQGFPQFFNDPNTILLLSLNLLLLLVFLYVTRLLVNTIAMLMPEIEQVSQAQAAERPAEAKIMHALTDAVPVEREHEILLDHEYDGIHELDNNLPPWWVWLFYATIIYSVIYLAYYHLLPFGESQQEEYISELLKAEEEKEAYLALVKDRVDENTVALLESEADLSAGRNIFVQSCQQCHAPDGGGGVGPNLTDPYWIHGGSMRDIFSTIKYGVPQKGMIAWESQLKPVQMAQVASYIKTLEGTVPLNPKEPQGEIWVDPTEAAPMDSVLEESIENIEEAGEGESENTAALKPQP